MIKRRYYRADRGDKDDDASSGSSSDSDVEVRSSDESEQDEPTNPVEADNDDDNDVDNEDENGDAVPSPLKPQHPSSSSSGYESEDSSANEIDAKSGDDDSGSEKDDDKLNESLLSRKEGGELIERQTEDHLAEDDLPRCVLKSKSVYKCRLCPKIVCLNEESLKTHLKSKRHSRSEKLLNEGRLNRILNSDGEEEVISDDDCETHAERHARIVALAQDTSMKKSKGRQRQRHRLKRKKNSSTIPNSGQQKENRAKRRKKAD